jgi:aminopeptidase YwaD
MQVYLHQRKHFLKLHQKLQMDLTLGDLLLCINVDGVGWREAGNTIAAFNLSEPLAQRVATLLAANPEFVQVEPWPQGDHMIFAMAGHPALALTSAGILTLVDHVIHTQADTVDIVSAASIAEVVRFLGILVQRLPVPES